MRKLILTIAICMMLTPTSWALEYEFGQFTVSQLRFGSGGLFVTLDPAPEACNGGTNYGMHFKVNTAATHYSYGSRLDFCKCNRTKTKNSLVQ